MYTQTALWGRRCLCGMLSVLTLVGPQIGGTSTARAEGIIKSAGVIQKITDSNDRLELTVNTSRILTLETKIPRIQVMNPELLGVAPLSATEVQISAKKAGVTQINLWDEEGKIYTVDVLVYGDAKELEHALRIQFPNSNINVYRYSNSLVLKGFVDRADYVSHIMRLAEDYAPKVINNITVGGVHDVTLRVKVMEVSRTKLRRLGFDFAFVNSGGGFFGSFVSGLIDGFSDDGSIVTSGGETAAFGVVDGNDAFFGFLDALERNDLLKVLAEPTLTTVSGRAAQFNVGGEFPVLVPQSLGTVSIEYKKFGTQVDFLPVILGNGNIRLEVRPRVSEIDNTRSVVINNITVPGLRVREIDTGVEMKAGQTLALAGLIQERVEAQHRGLPIISNVPYFGVPFRRVEHTVNEIELLIMVTPEYAGPMEPHEVPPGGPGTNSVSPGDCELYFDGYLEVPRGAGGCSHCAATGQSGCSACQGGNGGVQTLSPEGMPQLAPGYGPGFENGMPQIETVPPGTFPPAEQLQAPATDELGPLGAPDPADSVTGLSGEGRYSQASPPRYSRPRAPAYVRGEDTALDPPPTFIGPIGYDVQE